MFIKASKDNILNVERFGAQLRRDIEERDGIKLRNHLVVNCSLSKADLTAATPQILVKAFPSFDFISDYILFLRSRTVAHNEIGALEMLTGCVRKLTVSFSDENNEWLHPVFVRIVSMTRKFASQLDKVSESTKWRKKIVEVFREIFPLLHKERSRLAATCWLICQLLSLYIALDQVKLCSHILAALSQSLAKEGGFNPTSVPKSVAVTLFFYWGKYHVMEGKHAEAKEKLIWAFQHCPLVISAPNRRRIGEYLIPCMIASGSFPKSSLIEQCGTPHFLGLSDAIRTGDVKAYNNLLDLHMLKLASSGTLILIEKCKLICYRNLAKRVFCIMTNLTSDPAKLDLLAMETAWRWAEHANKDEMICALADLIYAGVMKGYVSLEHGKLVLSKITPFPSIQSALG